jgi:hypothetical protein
LLQGKEFNMRLRLPAVLATMLCSVLAACAPPDTGPTKSPPSDVEVFRGKVLNEDCVLFGYARTIVFKDFTSACSPDGGDTAGPVVSATAWFNCRLESQEVWARGLRWSQCTNGIPHESGGKAYMVTAYGCMGPGGINQGPCLMSDLPDVPLEVDPGSPESFLLRALNLRITAVLEQVMSEGGPSLEDRLTLIKAADLFSELADAGFKLGSTLESVGAVDAAHRLLDLATDFTPGVSQVKSAIIVITGTNPVTGEMVSDFERAVALAGLIVPSFFSGGAKVLVGSAHALEHVAESERPLANLASDLVGVVKRGEADAAEIVADLPCPGAVGPPSPLKSGGRQPGAVLSIVNGEIVPQLDIGRSLPRPPMIEAPCIRALGTITAEVVERGRANLEFLRKGNVGFGEAPRLDYAKTFRQSYSELNDEIGQVHHAVEQQVLDRYPGVATESEINSLPNLRGMPTGQAGIDLHQSKIRVAWDSFYDQMASMGRTPTKNELLSFARMLDDLYGSQFVPPIR